MELRIDIIAYHSSIVYDFDLNIVLMTPFNYWCYLWSYSIIYQLLVYFAKECLM